MSPARTTSPERAAAGTTVRAGYRRRRWIALAVALLVVAAAGAVAVRYVLISSSLLLVEQVEVTGTASVPLDDVRAAAAVTTGVPLYAVSVDEVTARVAALPGVAAVEVDKVWPHTLRVQVTERVPVAVARTRAGLWLVDSTGRAYAPVGYGARPAPGLPTLVVGEVAPQDPATSAALTVVAVLPDGLRHDLSTIEAQTPATVVLQLTGDREVRWGSAGSAAELAHKLAVLTALLSQPGRVYDVTSPDLPTIRR